MLTGTKIYRRNRNSKGTAGNRVISVLIPDDAETGSQVSVYIGDAVSDDWNLDDGDVYTATGNNQIFHGNFDLQVVAEGDAEFEVH